MSPRAWRGVLDDYSQPRLGRSLLDLATSVVPYLALVVAMYFTQRVSVALSLLFVVPAAGFLDPGHPGPPRAIALVAFPGEQVSDDAAGQLDDPWRPWCLASDHDPQYAKLLSI